ncbi:MAG: autotransporter outer membrane beta-barrel domain-containing protein [Alphaproteobacteria bacterium]
MVKVNKKLWLFALGVSTVVVSGQVLAANNPKIGTRVVLGVGNVIGNGAYVIGAGYYEGDGSAMRSASSVVAGPAALKATGNMLLNTISKRIAEASAFRVGGNSGSAFNDQGVWVKAGFDKLDDKTLGGKWKANIWNVSLGYDQRVTDAFLLGVALNYQHLDGDTEFNKGKMKDNYYGISPYAAFDINQYVSLQAIVGYTRIDKSHKRKDVARENRFLRALAPGAVRVLGGEFTGTDITSKPKSDVLFGALYANLRYYYDKFGFSLRPGISHLEEKQKGFTESNQNKVDAYKMRVTQASVRAQVCTSLNMVQPYLFVEYQSDISRTKARVQDSVETAQGVAVNYKSPNDQKSKSTWIGGLGLNFVSASNITGGIEGSYAQQRKVKNYGVKLRIRYAF